MLPKDLVEVADRNSRKRATGAIVAALAFLAIQVIARPVFAGAEAGGGTRIDWWAVNAVALLAVLATGGGLLNRREVRALVHDDLSRDHLRSATAAGYWVAMGLGLALYLVPAFRGLGAREAVYVIVTGSIVVSLLAFAVFERRAHGDA